MSLVLQKPICPRCHIVQPVLLRTSGPLKCVKCNQTFSYHAPPEPSVEELGVMVGLLQRKIDYYKLVLRPDEYNKLIDEGLAAISRAKMYMTHLEEVHTQAPQLLNDSQKELESLQKQRQELINYLALETRTKSSGKSTSPKPKINKLRQKLGEAVYLRLVETLGSEEKVLEAMKGA